MLQKILTAVGLVEPPKPKRTKRTHDLFCDCRNCEPSSFKYAKELMK